mgnify:FL=1
MTQIKKHSPLKKSPLRNPGQSLDEKMQDVLYDDVYFYIIISAFLVLIAMTEWGRQIFDTPPYPLLWTFIAVISVGVSIMKGMEALRKIKNIKLGRDGEKIVGQSLEKLRAKGYLVFHDIDTGRGNTDHVLVGPDGVFTIETKTRSKDGDQRISCNGRFIIEGRGISTEKPVIQAKGEAAWFQSFINDRTGLSVRVRPVIIYPGWFVSPQPKDAAVWVLNENAFPSFLDNTERIFDQETISSIGRCIEEYILEDRK